MAGITGRGTTFNLPNYVGTLFQLSPEDTPFLSAIGGLTGGRQADQKLFEWQAYDLRTPENPSNLEGQDAPSARHRVRQNIQNVVQIFHSTVDISYTKLAATGARAGLPGDNPVGDELNWQVEQELKALKLDIENVFLNGVFATPADNATARKTQGILGAITTNVVNSGAADDNAPLTATMVLDAMQAAWASGGLQDSRGRTLMTNATQKRNLSKLFITDKGYTEETRNIGGVHVDTIETDFGRVNLMLNRWMPVDQIAILSLEVCAPRFLMIPGKGFLFVEPLAKVGASEKSQIYGEIGLEYGSERQHAKVIDLSSTVIAGA
jgi:hypothetical protein